MTQRILLASGNAKKLAELRALCAELPIEILSPADLPDGLPEVVEDGDTFVANAIKKALAAAMVAQRQFGDGVWALADDSGLCVDALGGAPGVYSARFAHIDEGAAEDGADGGETDGGGGTDGGADGGGTDGGGTDGEGADGGGTDGGGADGGAKDGAGNAEDGANNAKLLRELGDLPDEKRGAAFHCVLVIAAIVDSAPIVLFMVDGSVRGRILFRADGDQGFGYDPLFWHEGAACSFARLSAAQKAQVSHRGQAVQQLKSILQQHFNQGLS